MLWPLKPDLVVCPKLDGIGARNTTQVLQHFASRLSLAKRNSLACGLFSTIQFSPDLCTCVN